MSYSQVLFLVQISLSFATLADGAAQETVTSAATQPSAAAAPIETAASYVLGPDDVIAIKGLDVEEISSASIRIDPGGYLSLPMLGRVPAGGLTVERLENELSTRLKTYVREPVVAISIVEYRSQPVSVIGTVGQPGVHQLEGRKTLIEILAKAGGLRPEAGNSIKITRRAEWGVIPLPSAAKDPSGQFSVAQVSLKSIMQGTNPEENILIRPHDVISVPRADLIYVVGEVRKPGGFILHERGTISGLQALAMAEGFAADAAPDKAIIVRQSPDARRVEIPANLRAILSGKTRDVELLPEDILFIPTNVAKRALTRTLQTAIQAVTSAIIYRGMY
jgi:polysaccharide export outer membrane protein